MITESQLRAKRNYLRKCKQVNLVIYPTEDDIRERVEDQYNVTGYIKQLIRDDIAFDEAEQLYYYQAENMTTKKLREIAHAMLECIGEPVKMLSVEDARRVYARFMAMKGKVFPGLTDKAQ